MTVRYEWTKNSSMLFEKVECKSVEEALQLAQQHILETYGTPLRILKDNELVLDSEQICLKIKEMKNEMDT